MAAPDRRRTQTLGDRPVEGGRRIRDNPRLSAAFDKVLLAISDQVYHLQTRKVATLQQLVDGSGVSERCILDVLKTRSDLKISTLVRLAAFFDYEVVVSFRRLPTTPPGLQPGNTG